MWLIGLVLGLVVGGLLAGEIGLLPGAILGSLGGWIYAREQAAKAPAPAAPAEQTRLKLLEAQVDWLYRETRALREELEALRSAAGAGGAGEAVSGTAVAAAPAMPTSAMPASAAAVAAVAAAAAPSLPPVQATPAPGAAAVEPAPAVTAPAVAAAVAEKMSGPPPEPTLLTRLMAGNPLAKIGVVLLFFGVASALRLAAEAGFFPPSLRLLLTAVAALAMIVFGCFKVVPPAAGGEAPHRTFGLALQGGGFALLYLVVHFMLARYALIGPGAAFALFGVLGVACVLLAARQDGPALAVLGLSGAFLAPLMAVGLRHAPLTLFSYFALLNVLILAVDWFRAWRVLNIAGFLFTLAIGMGWALEAYRPEHYGVTQAFLILFLLLYSATPVATALLRAPGAEAWREGMLIFGTPLVGAALQAPLMREFDKGLAWSALIASIYYFGLWALMFRRGSETVRILERAHLGIALALLTLTIPLAFAAQVTSAFWAVEGVAVLWFGVRQRRLLAQSTGLLMQVAAGGAFLIAWPQLGHSLPLLNDVGIGGLLLALAGLFSAGLLRRLEATAAASALPAAGPYLWALAWWFGIGAIEIEAFVARSGQAPALLLFVTLSLVALEGLGTARRWALPRHSAALLLPVLWLAAALGFDRGGHPLAGLMLLALPLGFAVHYQLLARQEGAAAAADLPSVFVRSARHLGAWWLAILVVVLELGWLAARLAPGVDLWPLLARGLAPALGLAAVEFALRRDLRPWASLPAAYRSPGAWPPALALALWSLHANLNHAGAGSGLPYLPLLNLFDLTQLLALLVLRRTLAAGDGAWVVVLRRGLFGLAGVWLTALAARIAHHWGGVPFSGAALWASGLCQALVTLLWTLSAIAAMIQAARTAQRTRWLAGFALLAVVGAKLLLVDLANAGTVLWTASLLGVALLVLAASYFAPLPPKETAVAGEGEGIDRKA